MRLAFQILCSLIGGFRDKKHLMSCLLRYWMELPCFLSPTCIWYCTLQQPPQEMTNTERT